MFDVYSLLANQLRDIYSLLEEKILSDKKYAPKWKVVEIPIANGEPQRVVNDLGPLLSLINTCERLAAHHDHQPVAHLSQLTAGEPNE